MSRFANPAATELFAFPDGCGCPGGVHADVQLPDGSGRTGDWMRLRTELGADDSATLAAYEALGSRGGPAALAMVLVEWNLLDDASQPVEPDLAHCALLWSDTWSNELDAWLDEHVRMVRAPNASGGRSGTGTPATARPNRAARRRRNSTTR